MPSPCLPVIRRFHSGSCINTLDVVLVDTEDVIRILERVHAQDDARVDASGQRRMATSVLSLFKWYSDSGHDRKQQRPSLAKKV